MVRLILFVFISFIIIGCNQNSEVYGKRQKADIVQTVDKKNGYGIINGGDGFEREWWGALNIMFFLVW